MTEGSFSKGVGQWLGTAEVYSPDGTFLGNGRDTREVVANDEDGSVTVDVSFEGPFSVGGVYTISDRKTHRVYQGPANYGYADVLGDGLISAHNYWCGLGMSQRFFLMVLPDASRQLSLAAISCGEVLKYVVVGEYLRQTDPSQPEPPAVVLTDPAAVEGDLTAGRGVNLLYRPGQWSGELNLLGPDFEPIGSTQYEEVTQLDGAAANISLSGVHFAGDASFTLNLDGAEGSTPVGDVLGSYSLSGGRAQSGTFLHGPDHTRVWRREVAAADGTVKGVIHIWYEGEQRIGAAYGALGFEES